VEDIRQIGYPVWAVGVCPRRSRNEFTFGSINKPINIAGVSISREDYIVADESGVVVIPGAYAVKVIELAKLIVLQEKDLLHRVTTNSLTSWDAV